MKVAVLVAATLSTGTVSAATVQLRLAPTIQAEAPLKGTMTIRPSSARAGDPRTIAISSREPVALELPADSTWIVETSVAKWWAGVETITAATRTREIRLWPAGRVSGVVIVKDARTRPRAVNIRLTDPPATPAARRGPGGATIECPIDDQGQWECAVPAMRLDLAIRSDGFIPHYRWDVVVERDKVTSLGTVQFRHGASIAGWARREDGTIDPAIAKARLLRLVAPGSDGIIGERLRAPVSSVQIAANGFFQFAGVEAGSYMIDVEQAGAGFGRMYPVEVHPNAEVLVKNAIVLRRPIRVEVTIDPPADPYGRPWHVVVARAADYSANFDRPTYDAAASAEGHVTIANQTAGRFSLSVRDSIGNPLHKEDVVITGEADARRSIRIRVMTVAGRVHYGKKPLRASLWFGGRYGAVRAQTQSDGDGEFTVLLPRGGPWPVEIASNEPALSTTVKASIDQFDEDEGSVEITIPENRIEGIVVDRDGAMVPEADVRLAFEGDLMRHRSDATGRFVFEGVPVGRAQLSALKRDGGKARSSTSFFLNVGENATYGPVELRLERSRAIKGIVRSPRGPVVGAAIDVMLFGADLMSGSSATTGIDGTFTLDANEAATSAVAIVKPPGFALRVYDLLLDGSPAILDVSGDGGTLDLTVPELNPAKPEGIVVLQNGRLLPTIHLSLWARGHGVQWSQPTKRPIPNVAAGQYRACIGPDVVMSEAEIPRWLRQARCAEGVLAPGGTLQLDLSPE